MIARREPSALNPRCDAVGAAERPVEEAARQPAPSVVDDIGDTDPEIEADGESKCVEPGTKVRDRCGNDNVTRRTQARR